MRDSQGLSNTRGASNMKIKEPKLTNMRTQRTWQKTAK